MSGKIMGKVWDLELPHNQLLVLLALADHADHEGNNVFPSLGLVAWKTGYSEQQVRRVMRELEKAKILKAIERAPGKPARYRIVLEAGTQKLPRVITPSKMVGVSKSKGLHSGIAYPLQNDHTTPDMSSAKNDDKPSLEPSKKKTERETLLEAISSYLDLAHCILVLIEVGYDEIMHKPNEYMSNILIKKYLPVLEELKRLEATTAELKCVYGHFKPLYDSNGWTFGVSSFVTKLQPYRALKKSAPARKPAPITQFDEPTEAERAALLEAVKTERPSWETGKEAVNE